jgi:hypothetical protein
MSDSRESDIYKKFLFGKNLLDQKNGKMLTFAKIVQKREIVIEGILKKYK